MTLVDERGRVFGKINLIDFAIGVFCLLLVPLAYGAYVMFRPPTPVISTIEPATMLQGKDLRIKLTGSGFRPFLRASVGDPRALDILVASPSAAEVILPELAPGTYDLVLFDESRELARKSGAITIVGAPVPKFDIVVQVSGTFTSVPEQVAKTLAAGAKFPQGSAQPIGEIVTLGPTAPVVVRMATAAGVLERAVPGMVRVAALLRLRCTPAGESCKVGEVSVGTGAMIAMPGSPAPFQISDVSPGDQTLVLDAGPLRQTVEVDARLATSPETLALLAPGAADTDRRLSSLEAPAQAALLVTFRKEFDVNSSTSSVDWSGPDVRGAAQILGVPRPLTVLAVTLKVPVERTPNGWQYKGSTVKLGAPFSFEGRLYSLRGWIVGVKVPAAGAARAAGSGRR